VRVIVITPQQGRFLLWLKFDSNPADGHFNEDLLEAATYTDDALGERT
jgi:hypothetical protein